MTQVEIVMGGTEDKQIVAHIDEELEDLIPDFFEDLYADIKSLKKFLVFGDLEMILNLGHNLKGAGGGYGFDRISEIGSDLEDAATAGDKGAVKTLIGELKDYLGRVKIVYVEME